MTNKATGSNRIRELLLLLAALIWGSGFILTKMALAAGLSAPQLMAYRFSGAALAFGVLFSRQIRGMTRADWLVGIGNGILLFLGFMTQTLGLVHTTPSRNAFLTAIYVVIVPFFSSILLRRNPGRRIYVGALICFIGVATLTVSGDELRSAFLAGDLLTLACAVFFAAHLIALEAAVRTVTIPRLIFLQMLTTAALSLLVLPFDPALPHPIDWPAALPAVLYLIIFSSCVAYFLQTNAQKHTSSSRAAILISTEALFGSIISVVFRFDAFSPRLVIGGLIIFGSILLVEWPEKPSD